MIKPKQQIDRHPISRLRIVPAPTELEPLRVVTDVFTTADAATRGAVRELIDPHRLTDRRFSTPAQHTVTVLDKTLPLVHAGFRDAAHDPDWLNFWVFEEPTEEETYFEPYLSYMIGNSGALIGDLGTRAITGVFEAIEQRQVHHQGRLTERHVTMNGGSFDMLSLGTVPRALYQSALHNLVAQANVSLLSSVPT